MSFGLFGAEYAFFDLFERQLGSLCEAAEELHLVASSKGPVAERCARIRALEAEVSGTAREITRELALTQIRALERQDIHHLNLAMVNTVRSLSGAATRIGLYAFEAIRPAAVDLASSLLEMVRLTDTMLHQLRGSGYASELRVQLATAKAEADAFVLLALGEAHETPVNSAGDVLEIIKWSQVFDRFEEALDRVEGVAGILEGILLKRA
jgi:uncharacterized protein Yka (UPF0111/DUF47 family)